METRGASSPGILVLTTGLSRPFMRLDKYPTLLKELERHMEVLPVARSPSAPVREARRLRQRRDPTKVSLQRFLTLGIFKTIW